MIKREAIEVYQQNPDLFIENILGATLEPYQKKITDAIKQYERVAVSSSHDLGKSFISARIVLWFMSCFPRSKCISSAPTHKQLQSILWAEMRTAYSKSKIPLGGKMNLCDWQLSPDGDWFALGITPKNEVSGESGQGTQSSFQGWHSSHMLLIFDEATGIPPAIWKMAEAALTSSDTKFLAIGNPTSKNSEFYRCFQSPDWHKIKLSCFDSPNLIANGITDVESLKKEIDYVSTLLDYDAQVRLQNYKVVKKHLLTLSWVVRMGLPRKWGIEHPLFQSKVLGEFPKDSDGTLIGLSAVEDAMLRVYYPLESDRKIIGVDVARYGADKTVLTAIHGNKFLATKAMIKKDVTEVTGEIIAMARDLGSITTIVVDETGIGGGVVDLLNEAGRDGRIPPACEIRGVQFGAACEDPNDKEKYVNIKARMFKLLADDLKSSDGLCLPREDVYLDELPTILYSFDSKGRLVIESKDDYKRRTGRSSPDFADSLALANFGKYDEMAVGSFVHDAAEGFGRPFAASLTGGREW